MNFIQSFIFFILIASAFNSCNLFKYEHYTPTPLQQELNSTIIKDSINATLFSQLGDKYTPFNFNSLTTNKPKEFLTLDSLYKKRSNITPTNNNYDSLLNYYNVKISLIKNTINKNKIYHTYHMDHIYLVSTPNGFTLHEDNFLFFPNFQLKKITPILSTHLSKKEKILFEYFSLQNPLFETDDSYYDNKMNLLVYEKFNNAIANEKNRKEDLIHTILYCVQYIRKYNEFNQSDIAEEIASKWLLKHNSTQFIPIFEKLTKKLNNYNVEGYTLKVINKNNQQTIIFTFDLNLVIIDTTIRK